MDLPRTATTLLQRSTTHLRPRIAIRPTLRPPKRPHQPPYLARLIATTPNPPAAATAPASEEPKEESSDYSDITNLTPGPQQTPRRSERQVNDAVRQFRQSYDRDRSVPYRPSKGSGTVNTSRMNINPAPGAPGGSKGGIASNININDPDFYIKLGDSVDHEELRLQRNAKPAVADTNPPPFTCGPSLGRTVVNGERDLERALRQLEMLCSRNGVRSQMIQQRFHERPGLKRKRLKSQRWQRRFKTGFQGVCRRVEELVRKGW